MSSFSNILILSIIICSIIDGLFSFSLLRNLNSLWLIIISIMLLVTMALQIRRNHLKWEWINIGAKTIPVLMAFYFILAIFGKALIQGQLEYSLAKEHLLCFLMFLTGIMAWRKEDNILEVMTFLFTLIIFIESALGIIEWCVWPSKLFGFDRYYYYNDGIRFDRNILRVSGTFQNPSYYGILLCMGLPLSLSMLFSKKSPIRWFSVLSSITCLIAILFTYSRLSYLATGLTMMILLYLVCQGKLSMIKQTKKILLGIGLILLCIIIVSPPIIQRVISLTNRADHSLRNRMILQIESMDMIRDFPLSGVGVGQYTSIYATFYHDSIAKVNTNFPHNNIIEYWVNWGIIPLILYILFLFSILGPAVKLIFHAKNYEDKNLLVGWVAVILIFTISGLTEETIWIPSLNIIFWVGMAAVWTICWDKKYVE